MCACLQMALCCHGEREDTNLCLKNFNVKNLESCLQPYNTTRLFMGLGFVTSSAPVERAT